MGRLLRKKNPARKRKKQSNGVAHKPDEGGSVKNFTQDSDQGSAEGDISPKKPPGQGIRKKNYSSAVPAKSGIGSFLDKCFQFLREVKAELKKVTWPSRKNTMGSTVVVIILVMIISFFLGLVDAGLSSLIRLVVQ